MPRLPRAASTKPRDGELATSAPVTIEPTRRWQDLHTTAVKALGRVRVEAVTWVPVGGAEGQRVVHRLMTLLISDQTPDPRGGMADYRQGVTQERCGD